MIRRFFALLACVALAITQLSAQSTGILVPIFTSSNSTYQVDGNISVTSFTLRATENELQLLEQEVGKYSSYIRLESINSGDHYKCLLFIEGQPEAEYVVKFLSSTGISEVLFDNIKIPVTDLAAKLNGLKK